MECLENYGELIHRNCTPAGSNSADIKRFVLSHPDRTGKCDRITARLADHAITNDQKTFHIGERISVRLTRLTLKPYFLSKFPSVGQPEGEIALQPQRTHHGFRHFARVG